MMEQMTAPPAGVWDALWPVVQTALTPEMIGAIAVTLAATHLAKILAEHWARHVTKAASRWRSFCALTSISVGALAGLVTWLSTDATWAVVPIVALGSGPLWRIVQALLPARVVDAMLTSTDRRYRRRSNLS